MPQTHPTNRGNGHDHRDAARDKIKRIAASGWCGRKHVIAILHASRTWLTTHVDLTRPTFFCESFQVTVPDSVATGQFLANLLVHFKLQHAFLLLSHVQLFTCASSSFNAVLMSNTELLFSPSFTQSISGTSRSHKSLISALTSERGRDCSRVISIFLGFLHGEAWC